VPPPRPGEQQLWEEVFDDWFWADRFHWPPQVVDELPLRTFERLKDVTLLVEYVRAEKAKRGHGGG
jgi:uncharacterized protein with von Willebrand factor type A (vWA) domain